MIIIDAMEFAFSNLSGATLCFITGDTDYAYLLAVLQKNPELKTIVISKGSIQSMLHYNAHIKMRWETDILMLPPTPRNNSVSPPGFCNDGQTFVRVTQSISSNYGKSDDTKLYSEERSTGSNGLQNQPDVMAYDEGLTDDMTLLRTIVRNGSSKSKHTKGCSDCAEKSIVSGMLRNHDPIRFTGKKSVKQFLAKAVEASVIHEVQKGKKSSGVAILHLQNVYIRLSKSPPSGVEMTQKDMKRAKRRPFSLFAPNGSNPKKVPPHAYATESLCKKWFILMFTTLKFAHGAVSDRDGLKSSILVDLRMAKDESNTKSSSKLPSKKSTKKLTKSARKAKKRANPDRNPSPERKRVKMK